MSLNWSLHMKTRLSVLLCLPFIFNKDLLHLCIYLFSWENLLICKLTWFCTLEFIKCLPSFIFETEHHRTEIHLLLFKQIHYLKKWVLQWFFISYKNLDDFLLSVLSCNSTINREVLHTVLIWTGQMKRMLQWHLKGTQRNPILSIKLDNASYKL